MRHRAAPFRDIVTEWFADPEFVAEYAALADEFALAAALIADRTEAKVTQADVARRMDTSQAPYPSGDR